VVNSPFIFGLEAVLELRATFLAAVLKSSAFKPVVLGVISILSCFNPSVKLLSAYSRILTADLLLVFLAVEISTLDIDYFSESFGASIKCSFGSSGFS
jgi:hypothetical protein